MAANDKDLTTVADFIATLQISPDPGQAVKDLYQRYITAASVFIQTILSRDFKSQAYVEYYHGTGGSSLVLKNYPVTAIASVTVDGVSIPAIVGTAYGYGFDGNGIYLRGYTFTKGVMNVMVSYTAGYATIPEDVALFTIELAARKMKLFDKKAERLGLDSQSAGGTQINFTKSDLTKDFKTLLQQYQRVIPV